MPWCPICKNEYKKGYTVCADCGAKLVESLEDVPVAIYFGEYKEVSAMVDFLKSNAIEEAYTAYDEKENQHEIFVKQAHEKSARHMLSVFLREVNAKKLEFADLGLSEDGTELEPDTEEELSQEAEGDMDEDPDLYMVSFDNLMEDEDEDMVFMESASDEYMETHAGSAPLVYRNKKEKAAEYKSSAQALLVVGIVGIALIVINELGILPINLSFNKIMVYGVMGTLFVLFILSAVYSLIQSKKILREAEAEDALSEQIKQYLLQHFPKETLLADKSVKSRSEEDEDSEEDDGEERLYFARTSKMKKALEEEFEDAPETMIEHLVDEYYEQLFA